MMADTDKSDTEQSWKTILENEMAQSTNTKWMVHLRADHSNLPDTTTSCTWIILRYMLGESETSLMHLTRLYSEDIRLLNELE